MSRWQYVRECGRRWRWVWVVHSYAITSHPVAGPAGPAAHAAARLPMHVRRGARGDGANLRLGPLRQREDRAVELDGRHPRGDQGL